MHTELWDKCFTFIILFNYGPLPISKKNKTNENLPQTRDFTSVEYITLCCNLWPFLLTSDKKMRKGKGNTPRYL